MINPVCSSIYFQAYFINKHINRAPIISCSHVGDNTITLTATDAYGNSSDCSFEITVDTILGTNDISDFGSLTLYPNPASHYAILSNPEGLTIDKVSVFDIQGRLITENQSQFNTDLSIDVSQWSAAVYLVIIDVEDTQIAKRLIINR